MTTFDLEPVKLSGEGEYNLDVIKEIRLTESSPKNHEIIHFV